MLKYTIATGKAETDILSTYGVHVSGTSGLLGRPDFKTQQTYEWDYLNGEYIDLRKRRYKPRKITMKCWLKAPSKQQAIEKMNTFFKAFDTTSLIRLHINFIGSTGEVQNLTKGLFYLVYLDSTGVSKYKWASGEQIVEFTITFTEPSPVKRVYVVDGTDTGNVIVRCNAASEFDIHWGDGSVDYDILGESDLQHSYTTTGKHYLMFVGVIGDISDVTITTSSQEITVTQIYEEI